MTEKMEYVIVGDSSQPEVIYDDLSQPVDISSLKSKVETQVEATLRAQALKRAFRLQEIKQETRDRENKRALRGRVTKRRRKNKLEKASRRANR